MILLPGTTCPDCYCPTPITVCSIAGGLTTVQSCCLYWPEEFDATVPTIWSDINCTYCPTVGGVYTLQRNAALLRGTFSPGQNSWGFSLQDVCTPTGMGGGVTTLDLSIWMILFCTGSGATTCGIAFNVLLSGVASGTPVAGYNQSRFWQILSLPIRDNCDSRSYSIPYVSSTASGGTGLPYCTNVSSPGDVALIAH